MADAYFCNVCRKTHDDLLKEKKDSEGTVDLRPATPRVAFTCAACVCVRACRRPAAMRGLQGCVLLRARAPEEGLEGAQGALQAGAGGREQEGSSCIPRGARVAPALFWRGDPHVVVLCARRDTQSFIKTITKAGQANAQPAVGDEVFVHYTGKVCCSVGVGRAIESRETCEGSSSTARCSTPPRESRPSPSCLAVVELFRVRTLGRNRLS